MQWHCVKVLRQGPKSCYYDILLMDKIRLITKDDDYPIIYGVLTIPGGAGFLPSTVFSSNGELLVWGPVVWDSNRGTPAY